MTLTYYKQSEGNVILNNIYQKETFNIKMVKKALPILSMSLNPSYSYGQ